MYSYLDLRRDAAALVKLGVKRTVIGRSLSGRNIYAFEVGKERPCVIVTAGIHARENVGCVLAVRQLYRLVSLSRPHRGRIIFVPMVNPDGAEIVRVGRKALSKDFAAYSDTDFRLWKANARGVDLNVNFDAGWGEGKKNVRAAGGENFIGKYPFSEPETAALRDFTLAVRPDMTVSYHAKGRVVYWYYGQKGAAYERDLRIASAVAEMADAELVSGKAGSAGGYKDWCVEKLSLPSLTLELVPDWQTHPLPDDAAEEEYALLKDLPEYLLGLL